MTFIRRFPDSTPVQPSPVEAQTLSRLAGVRVDRQLTTREQRDVALGVLCGDVRSSKPTRVITGHGEELVRP